MKSFRKPESILLALLLVGATGTTLAANIFDAAHGGTAQEVTQALAANPGLINAKNELGSTPLHVAATNPAPEVTRLLLGKGASVNAKDNNAATPLHLAAFAGKKEVVEMLLKAGANVHARDFRGRTPIDYAEQALAREKKDILVIWALKHPEKPLAQK